MVREAGQRKRVTEGKGRETDIRRNGERSGPEEESYREKGKGDRYREKW